MHDPPRGTIRIVNAIGRGSLAMMTGATLHETDDDMLPDGHSAAAAARRMPTNCRC